MESDTLKIKNREDNLYKILPIKMVDYKVHPDTLKEKQELIEEFTCPICLYLVNNPKICKKCDKLFCEECLAESMKINLDCTTCRQSFEEGHIPRGFKNLLMGIKVKCPTG